jgi:hypothetical protein
MMIYRLVVDIEPFEVVSKIVIDARTETQKKRAKEDKKVFS